MAPEIYLQEEYDHKADVWSLGVLLFFMLYRKFPFVTEYVFDDIK